MPRLWLSAEINRVSICIGTKVHFRDLVSQNLGLVRIGDVGL